MVAFDYSSLIGGAIAGILSGSLLLVIRFYLETKRQKAEDRNELSGLLSLVFNEMDFNNRLVKSLMGNSEARVELVRSMNSDAWEECRTRIAHLMDKEALVGFIRYYHTIEGMKKSLKASQAVGLSHEKARRSIEMFLGEIASNYRLAYSESKQY